MSKALDLALANLNRQLGEGSVIKFGTENIEPWPAISTGAFTLDRALGIGGLPRGRIVEIYGLEATSKTSLALSVVAQAQQNGERACYVDVENALDPVYMQKLGVNLDELLISQPSSGEDALIIVENLIKTNELAVIVVDSVAALVTRAELDGDMGDANVAGQARLMSKAMRKLVGITATTKTLVIFINQQREMIGSYYPVKVTSGGKALKFYSSVRIELSKKEDIKDKDTGHVVGIHVKAKVVKNRMGPPYRLAEFDVLYGIGINKTGCLIDAATETGIIEKSGGWLKYNGEAHHREKLQLLLEENTELAKEIEDKVLNVGN